MEKSWREQNQRILSQYPADADYPEPAPVMTSIPPEVQPVQEEGPSPDQPGLPLEAPAAPDEDPTPPKDRSLP
jgi:hypothetical protein